MKIIADREINRFGNRITWDINREKSEFCCKKLESLYEGFTVDSTDAFPKPYLKIKSGDDYYDGEYSSEEEVSFCPFCGIKIIVEVGIEKSRTYTYTYSPIKSHGETDGKIIDSETNLTVHPPNCPCCIKHEVINL